MWQKFKDLIPTILVTSALVVGGALAIFNHFNARQQEEITQLQAKNDSLRLQADVTRNRSEATNKLLQDALRRNTGGYLASSDSIETLNDARLNRLAELIAKQIGFRSMVAKTPAELERLQNEESEQVANRLTKNIQATLAADVANQDKILAATVRAEQDHIDALNRKVREIHAAGEDAMAMTHELTVRYLNSFNDQGVLLRVLTLPTYLIRDTLKLNLVSSRERGSINRDLTARMNAIEKRLNDQPTSIVKS